MQARLADNKRFAPRNSKLPPSLLQGMAACTACGYAYYRTSTRTTAKKIYYYRCLGSDNYRYEGGRVCASPPVRADYLDAVVWDHITGLLADPALSRHGSARIHWNLRCGREWARRSFVWQFHCGHTTPECCRIMFAGPAAFAQPGLSPGRSDESGGFGLRDDGGCRGKPVPQEPGTSTWAVSREEPSAWT